MEDNNMDYKAISQTPEEWQPQRSNKKRLFVGIGVIVFVVLGVFLLKTIFAKNNLIPNSFSGAIEPYNEEGFYGNLASCDKYHAGVDINIASCYEYVAELKQDPSICDKKIVVEEGLREKCKEKSSKQYWDQEVIISCNDILDIEKFKEITGIKDASYEDDSARNPKDKKFSVVKPFCKILSGKKEFIYIMPTPFKERKGETEGIYEKYAQHMNKPLEVKLGGEAFNERIERGASSMLDSTKREEKTEFTDEIVSQEISSMYFFYVNVKQKALEAKGYMHYFEITSKIYLDISKEQMKELVDIISKNIYYKFP